MDSCGCVAFSTTYKWCYVGCLCFWLAEMRDPRHILILDNALCKSFLAMTWNVTGFSLLTHHLWPWAYGLDRPQAHPCFRMVQCGIAETRLCICETKQKWMKVIHWVENGVYQTELLVLCTTFLAGKVKDVDLADNILSWNAALGSR
jgi:hypothetical protein